tara:strand:- start:98 stop:337 length:240 start_codon:yes stop_codon:yes gene_type:complete
MKKDISNKELDNATFDRIDATLDNIDSNLDKIISRLDDFKLSPYKMDSGLNRLMKFLDKLNKAVDNRISRTKIMMKKLK